MNLTGEDGKRFTIKAIFVILYDVDLELVIDKLACIDEAASK